MSRRIHDSEVKMLRAFDHLKHLDEKVRAWLDGNNHRVIRRYYAKRREYVVYVEAKRPRVRVFAPLIGDVLFNLRSSLDALAYTLAAAYTKPLPDDIAQDSEFPIFGDEDRQGRPQQGARLFADIGHRKIRGIDPEAQTIIESLQPYQLGQAFREHPLWILYDLARVDRHRLLHTVAANFEWVQITKEGLGPAWNAGLFRDGDYRTFVGPVEGRTVVMRIQITDEVPPGTKVDVPFSPALEIAFARGTPAAENQPVAKVLTMIYEYIRSEVFPQLSPFVGRYRS